MLEHVRVFGGFMKSFARLNAILSIIFSCMTFLFCLLFGIIVKDGMIYSTDARPDPNLFIFMAIAFVASFPVCPPIIASE